MTIEQVVDTFKKERPTDVETVLQNCGVSLRHLGSGSYRDVYQVDNLPLVVKIPSCWHGLRSTRARRKNIAESVEHSVREMDTLRRVVRSTRKYVLLQRFMPTIYHFNRRTGVMLMPKYGKIKTDEQRKICLAVTQYLNTLVGWRGDLSEDNYGVTHDGNIVVLDVGYLIPKEGEL